VKEKAGIRLKDQKETVFLKGAHHDLNLFDNASEIKAQG